MASTINYGNLTNYVDQLSQPIISRAVLEANTAKYVSIISGIKYATQINILDINPYTVQANNVANQGFTQSGVTIMSAITATVCPLKVQQNFVLEGAGSLESIWYGQLMRAGSYQENAPQFEEAFMKQTSKYVSQVADSAFWMGGYVPSGANAHSADTAGNTGFLSGCLGVLNQVYNTSASGSVTTISYSGAPTAANIFNIIEVMISNMDSDMLGLEDMSIWCAPNYVDLYKRALMNAGNGAGNFHYFTQGSDTTSNLNITIPGRSNITLRGTPGLGQVKNAGVTGNGYQGFILSSDANLAFLCDGESDGDKSVLWFSNDFDALRCTTKFKAGGISKITSQVIVY